MSTPTAEQIEAAQKLLDLLAQLPECVANQERTMVGYPRAFHLAQSLASAAEAATRAAQPKPCAWKYDEDDSVYATDCGHYICLIEGTPEHNDYKFCPGCGGTISVAPPPKAGNEEIFAPNPLVCSCGVVGDTHICAKRVEGET